MKKIIVVLLVVVMSIVFSACNSGKTDNKKIDITTYEKTDKGGILISPEEFSTYISEEKLITENWKEYFDVYEDENGVYGLRLVEREYAAMQFVGRSATIELEDLKTKETVTYKLSKGLVVEIDKSYDIKDFKCIRIEGTVLIAEIPKELWQTANPNELWVPSEEGVDVVYVGTRNAYVWYTQDFGEGTDMQKYLK